MGTMNYKALSRSRHPSEQRRRDTGCSFAVDKHLWYLGC